MKLPGRIIVAVLLFGWIAYHFWNHHPHPWTWMQTVGVCLMAIGFPLWLIAHMQLGASFSVSAQARVLVTHGLYAKIRNPIYVFGLIGGAGSLLFLGRPYLLLICAILIPMQIARARREGQVLEEKFGDEYRTYRQKTWF